MCADCASALGRYYHHTTRLCFWCYVMRHLA